jgi:hypothetical protein
MNDQELITALQESVAGAHMPVPVDQIVSRSRAIRARRRMTGAAGAVAAAAGAALAVAALLPPGHQPRLSSRAQLPSRAQLAAWTVARQADGDITVTIREWRDPAGLQAALRADGLRVVVTPPANAACQPYTASTGGLNAIVQVQTPQTPQPPAQVREENTVLVIDPSAIPSGAGLSISDAPPSSPVPSSQMNQAPPGQPGMPAPVSLVDASQQCTGS